MDGLSQLILGSEDALVEALTGCVGERGYSVRVPGTEDGVRRSVKLTSKGLATVLERGAVEAPRADDDLSTDTAATVGCSMAARFRNDGLDFTLLFGLLKCSRRAYGDVVRGAGLDSVTEEAYLTEVGRYFDKVELGFVSGWTDLPAEEVDSLLRNRNREMMEERNRYQSAFQSLPVAVLFLDAEGKLFGMNAVAGALFDRSERRWWPGVMRGGSHREQAPVLVAEIGDFAASPDRERGIECELKTGKGRRFFQVRFTKLFDVGGACTGMLVILSDLTYRRRAEEALRRSQAKYQALFENSTSPTIYMEAVLDRRNNPVDMRILEANAAFARLAGAQPDSLVGHTLRNRHGIDDETEMETYITTLTQVAVSGEAISFDTYVPALGRSIRGQAFCPQPGFVGVIIDRVEP